MTNKLNICQAKLSKSQTEVSTGRQKLPENAFLDSLCEEEKFVSYIPSPTIAH